MLVRIASKIAAFRRKGSRPLWLMRLLGLKANSVVIEQQDVHAYHRGLVMIQIDGLSRDEFQSAIELGELPFLNNLINTQNYEVHSMYSGLPSSTPAVQGELFYGVKTAVPAFSHIDRTTKKLVRMFDPSSAKQVESKLSAQGRPLLEGGSAYCNIYTGGANESHYCASSIGLGHSMAMLKPLARIGIGLIFLPTLIRTAALITLEIALAVYDFFKGVFQGKSLLSELKFIFSRVAICVALRDFVSIGAQIDILRGLPVVHLNLIGYDEQAHRRGPHSAFAHWTLKGIDRCIKRIWQACNTSTDRHYDLWIYSDHGQESTVPYETHAGKKLLDTVNEALRVEESKPFSSQTIPTTQTEKRSAIQTQGVSLARAQYLGEKLYRPAFKSILSTKTPDVHQDVPFQIAAMGPVGHLYADYLKNAAKRSSVATYLATIGKVPAVMYIDSDNDVVVKTSEGHYQLPNQARELMGENHPFAEEVGSDLILLAKHENAGQVVLLGWAKHVEPISFPFENGAHAGPGSRETHAFALLPTDTEITATADGGIRPLDLRRAAFDILHQKPQEPTSNRFPRPRNVLSVADRNPSIPANNPKIRTLRVMTYNVHSCIGMDGKHSPERIARVIAQFEPDVVALQELDVNQTRSRRSNQAQLISRLLEMEYHFHPNMQMESGEYGNAILTHLPLSIVKAEKLPTHPTKKHIEPRGAIWVSVDFLGIPVQIVCTHLGLFPEERLNQIQALKSKQWLGHESIINGASILCGDFNAGPKSRALRTLGNHWKDVQAGTVSRDTTNYKTFSSILPALRIDHIFTSAEFKIGKVQVPSFELARKASDHLPLVVDLELKSLAQSSLVDENLSQANPALQEL